MATPMFSGPGNSVALLVMLYFENGSEKFNMADAKPDVPVSQLLYNIAKKFQRLSACFPSRGTQWRYRKDFISKPELSNLGWQHFINDFTMHAVWNKEYNI
jgi:hypothetical protein